MSIYRSLNIERPIIQYSIVHQPARDIALREYQKNMLEMHRAVHQEAKAVAVRWEESVRESAERSVQAIRGSLMPFLTTPLQSDTEEISRHISEQVRSVIGSTVPHGPLGPLSSTEGRYDVDPLRTGPLKSVTSAGKRYLDELGFKATKAAPPIFESTFHVEGGINLDILEHIVRDRMGIYASLHGKHIREAAAMTFAVHNLVYRRGELDGAKGVEAILFFSKGSAMYEAFRSGLTDALDAILRGQHPDQVSVWQRKLGLGRGREFQLRIRAHGRASAAECVDRLLRSSKGGEAVESLRKGMLLYREILGPAIGS